MDWHFTMPSATDPYDILGIPQDATPEEVKAAHRALARVWHPDRFGDDDPLRAKAEERIKRINAAYEAIRSGNYRPRLYRAVRVRPTY